MLRAISAVVGKITSPVFALAASFARISCTFTESDSLGGEGENISARL
jgi:hypothetical protein